ncbi:MAG: M15 family metallopeptidase, partial [Acidimicrobiia bacterium]|nr:M15 family metallopeptidase [Acidimicrobiia bacterium]
FQRVTANLAAEQAAGRYYAASVVSAFVPRTIGGARQLSRHTLGISIDINPAQNPYSTDPDRLITNIPAWYVEAWRDAGFCWGGDWIESKDPMHFAWEGPGPDAPLVLRAPGGSETAFTPAETYPTAWGDLASGPGMVVADLGGFGALDVGRLRPHAKGTVIDVVPGRSGFLECSHYRWLSPAVVPDLGLATMGDVDGDSRSDLVAIDPAGSVVVARRADEFEEPVVTQIDGLIPAPAFVTVGDFDGDHRGDLLVASSGGQAQVRRGTDPTDVIADFDLGVSPRAIAVGDREGDGEIELFVALDDTGVRIYRADGTVVSDRIELDAVDVVGIGAADEDGEGRSDISRLEADGTLHVATGNSPTGRAADGWWRNPDYECDDDWVPLVWNGTFYDDDTSMFEADIEVVADLGVTRGCNPPFADAYCPDDSVTRGQMAAFLVRMFELSPSGEDRFTDDGESEFEDDINALAAAGITSGCTQTSFCPDLPVSRGQMAAFLVRALELEADTSGNRFADDDQSVFENDIEVLAAFRVTRGCDPPANSRFCPDSAVDRGEMAAFLGRTTQID